MARIKICGLKRPCDIDFVNEGKPDFCGFIINVPKSRRSVRPEEVQRLTGRLHDSIIPVGVFVDSPIETILSLVKDGAIRAVQLHGHEDDDYVETLRQELKTLYTPVIQAFPVTSRQDAQAAAHSHADYILLDNGAGGTGISFDWTLLSGVSRPFFLAGGLTPDNLAKAVKKVRPYAVDLSSGVETDGIKDKYKILAAIAAVRSIKL